MEQIRTQLKVGEERALLVNVTLPDSQVPPEESLAELTSLVEAAGAEVVGAIVQKRNSVHPAYYVGHGKAEEIGHQAHVLEADVVIFDNDLSPAQIRELEKITECKILDRSEVILDIFASRAQTYEAKLQVDLAQLQYTYPRLTRMWSHLDTVTGAAGGGVGAVGGIGTRGTGEKQLEIDRRLVNKRVTALRREIERVHQRKQRQVKSRDSQFTVSLVGYTNAGKSTLMNLLTDSDTFVKDQLFATLDTKTARWNLGGDNIVLLSDTVGFVRDLPHHLVASFRATLEEATHADLLLHVVDASQEHVEVQIAAVETVLQELGSDMKDSLMLLNKVDQVKPASRLVTLSTLFPDALPISAKDGTGMDAVAQAVSDRLTGEQIRLRVGCRYDDGKVHSFLRAHGTIINEDYTNTNIIVEANLGRRQLPGLQRLGPEFCDVISGEQE